MRGRVVAGVAGLIDEDRERNSSLGQGSIIANLALWAAESGPARGSQWT